MYDNNFIVCLHVHSARRRNQNGFSPVCGGASRGYNCFTALKETPVKILVCAPSENEDR